MFVLFILSLGASLFAQTKPKYISPNNDGIQDELEIPLKISDKRYVESWSLIIMDENRNPVRAIGNKVALPKKVGFKGFFKQLVSVKQGIPVPEKVIWNGALDSGETAPDGIYYYYFTAKDDNGNFKFPIVNGGAGVRSIAGLRVEVDENLVDGDFVIGNISKYYKANLLAPLSVEKERDAIKHVSSYVASQFCAAAPFPGAFVHGSKASS